MSLISTRKSFKVDMADFQQAEKSCSAAEQSLQTAISGLKAAIQTIQDAQITADDEIYAHQTRINELNYQKQTGFERAKQLENTLMLLELQLTSQEATDGAQ